MRKNGGTSPKRGRHDGAGICDDELGRRAPVGSSGGGATGGARCARYLLRANACGQGGNVRGADTAARRSGSNGRLAEAGPLPVSPVPRARRRLPPVGPFMGVATSGSVATSG